MEEIAPGLRHWTAMRETIGMEVSSYWLVPERVVLDPVLPEEGIDAFAEESPEHVILTNRHHDRRATDFVAAYGCTVHVVREGLHEFADGSDLDPIPFAFGDELPGGLRDHPVYSEWPDEGAVEIPRVRALAIADGVLRTQDGKLGFFSDDLLGDDPAAVRRGLVDGYLRLVEKLDPQLLLLAHGGPLTGDLAGTLRGVDTA